jgi:hypothetical protein
MKWLALVCRRRPSPPASSTPDEKSPRPSFALEHFRTRLAELDDTWSPTRVDVAPPLAPYYYPARSPQLERLRLRLAEVDVLRTATEGQKVEAEVGHTEKEEVEVLASCTDARPLGRTSLDQRRSCGGSRRSFDAPPIPECPRTSVEINGNANAARLANDASPCETVSPRPAGHLDVDGSQAVHDPAAGLAGPCETNQPSKEGTSAGLEPSTPAPQPESETTTPLQPPPRTSSLRRAHRARVEPSLPRVPETDLTVLPAPPEETDGAHGAEWGEGAKV